MSTTQRPTPETDAAIRAAIINEDEDHERLAAVARQLERERDEARDWQNVKVSKAGETHTRGTLIQLLEHERDEKEKQLEAMREAIKNIYYLTEGCADGAPDASAHDKLCNEIADKLQPFLKP